MKKIFQMGLVALVSVSMSEAVMAQIGARSCYNHGV